jgi:hypothetical protein
VRRRARFLSARTPRQPASRQGVFRGVEIYEEDNRGFPILPKQFQSRLTMWGLSFGRRDVQPLIEGHQNTKLRRPGWRGATAAAECQTHYAGVRRPLEGCRSPPQTNSRGCTWQEQSLQQLSPSYKLFRAQQLMVVELYSCGRLGHAREARKPPPGVIRGTGHSGMRTPSNLRRPPFYERAEIHQGVNSCSQLLSLL